MGFSGLFKKAESPELALAKENLSLQEKGLYMKGGMGYEELPNAQQKNDLIKWQQELKDELENLKHRLRSEIKVNGKWAPRTMKVRDEEGNDVEVYVPPLANELFVDYIQSQVEPFLSRNLINANFTEKRVLAMLKFTCNDYCDAMVDGYDRFDIDFINANLIDRLIKNVIIPGPFRAVSGFTKVKDTLIAKRIEGYIDRPDKAGSNMGNLFNTK